MDETEILIGLCERFMPKSIAVDNPKELAMYELYHRLKSGYRAKADRAVEFAEWLSEQPFVKYEGGFWARDNEDGKYTTEQLYQLFLTSINK